MPARRLKRGRKELSTDGNGNSVNESEHSDQDKHKKVRWEETAKASDAEDEASRSEEETTGDKVIFVYVRHSLNILFIDVCLDLSSCLVHAVSMRRRIGARLFSNSHTHHSGRVGCAYYDPVKFILHVMEDTEESPHFDLIKIR